MNPKRPKVFLFDVDGTLVHAGGAGRRAFERAVADLCGAFDGALARLRLDGMTDRLIVRESLALLGRPFDDSFCDRILARYVEHLPEELARPGYRVLPGVVGTLEALGARGELIGLCTGNVVDGARLKLARGALDGYFDWDANAVCGFAHDGEERERIVQAALARASARLGEPVQPREALVIGDTPKDIAAAHHAGVPVLAVGTGRFPVEELRACGADHAAATLEDADAVRVLLG